MKLLIAALATLLIALQVRLWFGEGSVQEVWRVREEALATRAEVVQLRSRNQALRAEVNDLKSGLEAVEERARTDLGMIDADETFYQFVRETDGARLAPATGADDDIVDGAETAPLEAVSSAPSNGPPAPDAYPASDAAGRIERDGG